MLISIIKNMFHYAIYHLLNDRSVGVFRVGILVVIERIGPLYFFLTVKKSEFS